jgi:hypothetical protein
LKKPEPFSTPSREALDTFAVRFMLANPCDVTVTDRVGLTNVPETFIGKLLVPIAIVPFPVTVPVLSSRRTVIVVGVPKFENVPTQFPVADIGAMDSSLEQLIAAVRSATAATPANIRLERPLHC